MSDKVKRSSDLFLLQNSRSALDTSLLNKFTLIHAQLKLDMGIILLDATQTILFIFIEEYKGRASGLSKFELQIPCTNGLSAMWNLAKFSAFAY